MIAGKLKVTVSKTRQGDQDYMQIMSDDATSINIVLVAQEIVISDARPGNKKKK